MAGTSRDRRVLVKLRSTAGTGFTYYTRKNKITTRGRLELMKYDPKVRRHVLFREDR
jgi:large subunit ribosomal protein L33